MRIYSAMGDYKKRWRMRKGSTGTGPDDQNKVFGRRSEDIEWGEGVVGNGWQVDWFISW